jgi:hypothetical protein
MSAFNPSMYGAPTSAASARSEDDGAGPGAARRRVPDRFSLPPAAASRGRTSCGPRSRMVRTSRRTSSPASASAATVRRGSEPGNGMPITVPARLHSDHAADWSSDPGQSRRWWRWRIGGVAAPSTPAAPTSDPPRSPTLSGGAQRPGDVLGHAYAWHQVLQNLARRHRPSASRRSTARPPRRRLGLRPAPRPDVPAAGRRTTEQRQPVQVRGLT